MFNWLIEILGGYTTKDLEVAQKNFDSVVEAWRGRALAAETTIELYKEIMLRERANLDKIRELSNEANATQQVPPNMKPLGNTVGSWPRIRRELEKQGRQTNAQVSREEIEKTIRSGE